MASPNNLQSIHWQKHEIHGTTGRMEVNNSEITGEPAVVSIRMMKNILMFDSFDNREPRTFGMQFPSNSM
jgi:hypothetical protein